MTAPRQTIPRSYVTASRDEVTRVPLEVVEGEYPAGITGSYFLVGPCGTVAAGGLPFPEDQVTAVLNGDGMISRIDFLREGAFATTRIARTPSFYADEATQDACATLRFRDFGIARISALLGARNFLNTAFLPMGGVQGRRLLMTTDAGVPWELDPMTLELLTPVGSERESYADGGSFYPFPVVFASAHPVWDNRTGEGFFANYGRGISDYVKTLPLVHAAGMAREAAQWALFRAIDAFNVKPLKGVLAGAGVLYGRARGWLFAHTPSLLQGVWPQQFTFLMRWTGEGDLERWRLVQEDGTPVAISESIHQMALTRNHVVLADTAFVISLRSLMTNPYPESATLDRIARDLTALRIGQFCRLYVVKRADLAQTPGARPAQGEADVTVRCRCIDLPMGAAHFLASYGDDDDILELYLAHNTATDVSQWVTTYDTPIGRERPVDPRAWGLPPAPMDLTRLARYAVDIERGHVHMAETLAVEPQCWMTSLYASPTSFTPLPQPERIRALYWNSLGFSPDTATQFIFDLYAHYPSRIVPRRRIRDLAHGDGAPATVFRTDIDTMAVVDSYTLPWGQLTGSPQFVFRHGADESWHEEAGFLVCMGYTDERNEVWIFDGGDLAKGPICKLASPAYNVGFTAHSAWLPLHLTVGERAPYFVECSADLERAAARATPVVRRILQQDVIPKLPRRRDADG